MINMTYQLYNGDCLDIVPTLPAGSIDAIITDLPYGTTACKWDTIIPFADLWRIVKHILKPRGAFVTTASQPFTSALVMSNPKWFQDEWIWIKSKSTRHLDAKKRPMKKHENIIVFSGALPLYIPQMVTGQSHKRGSLKTGAGEVYNDFSNRKVTESNEYFPHSALFENVEMKPLHPTQKPVALYEYLIRTYTNEGDTILDLTMGSGTTIIAAMNTNRSSIGIEKDAAIFQTAKNRIEAIA